MDRMAINEREIEQHIRGWLDHLEDIASEKIGEKRWGEELEKTRGCFNDFIQILRKNGTLSEELVQNEVNLLERRISSLERRVACVQHGWKIALVSAVAAGLLFFILPSRLP